MRRFAKASKLSHNSPHFSDQTIIKTNLKKTKYTKTYFTCRLFKSYEKTNQKKEFFSRSFLGNKQKKQNTNKSGLRACVRYQKSIDVKNNTVADWPTERSNRFKLLR